jgi:hypothetical protein
MKKIIKLNESDLTNLVKRIINEERELRMYGLDWDDNILRMPTKIYLKDDLGEVVGMATDDFAEYRHLIGKEPFDYEGHSIVGFDDDAFRDFTHPETFLTDTKKAIEKGRFAPSVDKFKENLIYGNPFSIITARGHNPQVLKKGVRLFIDMMLTDSEKETMVDNIKDALQYEKTFSPSFLQRLDTLSDDQVIDLYLDERGEYYPVSSTEFGERFNLPISGGAANPEHAKKVAIGHFVDKVFKNVEKLVQSGEYKKVSFGFSDDDVRNVKASIEFLEDELSKMYPEIHFVVYDTSEGGKRKIVIEKE